MVGVAQLAERWVVAPEVEGSSPFAHPIRRCSKIAYGPVAQLVEQGTLNPKVQGSNPCRSTTYLRRSVYILACFNIALHRARFIGGTNVDDNRATL